VSEEVLRFVSDGALVSIPAAGAIHLKSKKLTYGGNRFDFFGLVIEVADMRLNSFRGGGFTSNLFAAHSWRGACG